MSFRRISLVEPWSQVVPVVFSSQTTELSRFNPPWIASRINHFRKDGFDEGPCPPQTLPVWRTGMKSMNPNARGERPALEKKGKKRARLQEYIDHKSQYSLGLCDH